MSKMKECNSYPCYEYRRFGNWGTLTESNLRKRHSTHGIVVTSAPFAKGTHLREGLGNMFASLVHKGKKR